MHAVAGGRVVVASGVRTLHVLDGATGRELSVVHAPAAPIHLCAGEGAANEVWAELEAPSMRAPDPARGGVVLDVVTGKVRMASGPPRGCGFRALAHAPPQVCGSTALCSETGLGRSSARTLVEGGIGIGIEAVEATHADRLFAVDVAKRTPLWERTLEAPASFMGPTRLVDLAQKRLYVQYLTANMRDFHLDCLDAARGAVLWTYTPSATLQSPVDSLRVGSSGRVYVSRRNRVEVVDGTTGALLGILGG